MIRFRMTKINTEQFAVLQESIPEKDKVTLSLNIELKYAAAECMVAVGALFTFSYANEKFMILKVLCEFQIHPDDWKDCTSDNVVTIPKDCIDYLLSQTVGTARGILHCKTEGTGYNDMVLPPLNVSEVIEGDVKITI